jgi:hypothetical protein
MITKAYCIVITFHSLGTGQSKAFVFKGIHSYISLVKDTKISYAAFNDQSGNWYNFLSLVSKPCPADYGFILRPARLSTPDLISSTVFKSVVERLLVSSARRQQ